MKSDIVKKGLERAPHRSLILCFRTAPGDLEKPLIGIVNSFSDIVPGHAVHDEAVSAYEGIKLR